MKALLNILLVDDHEEILEIIKDNILSHFHAQVLLAKSGAEAIDIIDSGKKIDFIICDYQMPNGNGKEVFDHVQNLCNHIYFILFTSTVNYPEFKGKNFLGVVDKLNQEKLIHLIRNQFFLRFSG